MKKVSVLIFSFFLLCFSVISIRATQSSELEISGYINDYAGVLDASQKQKIEQLGKALDEKTGAQVVFVITDTLDGEDIFDVSYELASENEIGSKDNDTGVLFLMATQDREYFMQVGYGLEGILGDIETNHLQNTYLLPYLKSNEYAKGIVSLYEQVVNVIEENADEVGVSSSASSNSSNSFNDEYGYSSNGYQRSSGMFSMLFSLLFFGAIFFLVYYFGFRKDSSGSYSQGNASSQSIELYVGEDFQIQGYGYDFQTMHIMIASRDPNIVSVSTNGWIHANSVGSTQIVLQKSGEEQRIIPVTVSNSHHTSSRRNYDVLGAFLVGSLAGSLLGRRRRYYGPGYGDRRNNRRPPGGGFGPSGGFGPGPGGGSGGFRGGGGSFGGGGSGGRW
jgi:uncharacterized protein